MPILPFEFSNIWTGRIWGYIVPKFFSDKLIRCTYLNLIRKDLSAWRLPQTPALICSNLKLIFAPKVIALTVRGDTGQARPRVDHHKTGVANYFPSIQNVRHLIVMFWQHHKQAGTARIKPLYILTPLAGILVMLESCVDTIPDICWWLRRTIILC